MTNKEVYKEFCALEKDISLFLTHDWLETVAPNTWDVVLEKRGDKIIGVLPYVIKISKGFRYIELPPFTPTGGVWIKHEKDYKSSSKIRYEKEIYSNLIKGLPYFDSFYQKFHPSITNWFPFYLNGFTQTIWYKYTLNNISDTESIFTNLDSETRRNIRKAEKTIQVTTDDSIDSLIELKFKSYKTNRQKTDFDKSIFQRIYSTCINKNIGEVFIAKENNKVHASALFVWDTNSCHFLISASDPDFKNSGAMTLIVWHAIQKYSKRINTLILEGSMIPGIEEYLRSFGGEQTPYSVISKTNSKILKIKKFLNQL